MAMTVEQYRKYVENIFNKARQELRERGSEVYDKHDISEEVDMFPIGTPRAPRGGLGQKLSLAVFEKA